MTLHHKNKDGLYFLYNNISILKNMLKKLSPFVLNYQKRKLTQSNNKEYLHNDKYLPYIKRLTIIYTVGKYNLTKIIYYTIQKTKIVRNLIFGFNNIFSYQ